MTPTRLRFATFAIPLWVAASCSGDAFGQGLTPDPYNIVGEYNSQYAPFMYAVEPNLGGVIPNQNRMQERSAFQGANRFQSDTDSLDGAGPDEDLPSMGGRRAGIGTPYYRAYRSFDKDYNRLYRPNETADRSYFQSQNQRNNKYFEAMKEPDPRKRAQLLREYNMENLRASRTLSTARGVPERDPSRVAPRPSGGTGSLLDRSPLPGRASAGTRRGTVSPPDSPLRDRATGRLPVPPARDGRRISSPLDDPDDDLRGTESESTSELLERSELFDRRSSRAPAPRPSPPARSR